MKTASVTVRLDENVKNSAKQVYKELGIDMSTAIDVFLRQSIRSQGFPFDVTIDVPNKATLKAIDDADKGVDMYGPFNTFDEMMESLHADD